MPFDAAPVRVPLPDNISGQSALMLDAMEFFFAGGTRWAKGALKTETGNRCLIGGLHFVREQIPHANDRVTEYLVLAMHQWYRQRRNCEARGYIYFSRALSAGARDKAEIFNRAIFVFNDARARTFRDILEVLHNARTLALSDAAINSEVGHIMEEQRQHALAAM